MAARYRKIDPRIWRDEKFIKLNAYEKLIALYCLTASPSNRCGIFVFSPAMAEEEIGSLETFLEGLLETLGGTLPLGFRVTFLECFLRVVSGMGWRWEKATRVLYLPTWWKYNQPDSENVLKGNLKDLHELPQTPLLAEFYANTKHLPREFHSILRGTLPPTLPQTLANSGTGTGTGTGDRKEPADERPDPCPNRVDSHPPETEKPKPAARDDGSVARAIAVWRQLWKSKYNAECPYSKGRDNKAVDWMLEQTARSVEALETIFVRYLATDESFYANENHPLGLLRQNFQKWIVANSAAPNKSSTASNPKSKRETVHEVIERERKKQSDRSNTSAKAETPNGSQS